MKELLFVVSSESRKPADEKFQVVFVHCGVRATELLFAMKVTGAQEVRMFFSFPGSDQPPPPQKKGTFVPGG